MWFVCTPLHECILLSLAGLYHELEGPLVGPDRNGATGRRLDETNGQALVKATEALARDNGAQGAESRLVFGNVAVDVAGPGGTLDLDALSHEVQRKHGRLGNDATSNAGRGVSGAPRQLHVGHADLEALVGDEKDAHVGDNLGEGGRYAAKEAAVALVLVYGLDGAQQAAVDLVGALGGEAGAQQVEGVGHGGGGGARRGAGDEALGGVGQLDGQLGLEEEGDGAVGGKLRCGVADVHELRGDVALPKGRDALIAKYVGEGGKGALVCVLRGGGRGLGAGGEDLLKLSGLELETDFYDVERCNDESGCVSCVRRSRGR